MSVISHQNLLFISPLTRSELLPRQIYTLYFVGLIASSGLLSCKETYKLLLKLTLNKKSKKFLSLRPYCPSPSLLNENAMFLVGDDRLMLIVRRLLHAENDALHAGGSNSDAFLDWLGSLRLIVKHTTLLKLRKGLCNGLLGSSLNFFSVLSYLVPLRLNARD